MKTKKRFDPRHYPIVVRVVQGFIEISQPDLEIYRVRGRIDQIQSSKEIGEAILDVMNEALKKYSLLLKDRETPPEPSSPKQVLHLLKEPLFTIQEVSIALGVSQETVRRLCAAGRLGYVLTPGGHRRFKRDDIEKFQAGNKPGENPVKTE